MASLLFFPLRCCWLGNWSGVSIQIARSTAHILYQKTTMLRIASRLNRVCVRTFQSSSRVLAEDAPAGAEATKVTLNFAVPHQAIYESTEVSFWTSIKTNFPLLSTCALPQHCLCGQHKALEKCAKCRCCTTHINKDPRVGHPPFSIFF